MLRLTLLRLALVCAFILAGIAALQAAPTVEQSYTAAKKLYDLRLNGQAIGELQKFIVAYPTDARITSVLSMLGQCYQRQQQYDKALAAYDKIIKQATGQSLAPLRAETHYQIADCYLAQKQYEKAIQSYENCLQINRGNTDLTVRAHYWEAECLYQLKRFAPAEKHYTLVSDTDPNHALAPWAIYSFGMINLHKGVFDKAIAALEQVTTRYATSEVANEAALMLGFAYAGRAQKSPINTPARDADYQQAIARFTAILDDAGSTATAKQHAALALAEAYFNQKDYAKAEATYTRALEMMNRASQLAMDTRLRRGHTLFNAERYRDAVGEYATVANGKFPELTAPALYWMGNSWYQVSTKEKDHKAAGEAIAAFRRFLVQVGVKHLDAPRAQLLVAFCLEDMSADGDVDIRIKAIQAFQEIKMRWPATREAGQAQDGIDRLTATISVDEMRKVVEKLPPDTLGNVDLTLARKEFTAKNYDNALTVAQKVLAANSTGEAMVQASYIVGACQQQKGNAAAAIGFYKKVLDAAPTGELAPYALRGLIQADLDTQRFPDARDAALTLLKLPQTDDEKAQALMYLGNAYNGTRQYDEAMAAYKRVTVECTKSDLLPHACMGIASVAEARKDDRTEIIARYQEVVAKYPDHDVATRAIFRIGINQVEQKDYAKAIDSFNNIPPAHRLGDQAAYAIAWAYKDMGNNNDKAIVQFTKVAEQFPTSVLAADSLSQVGEYWLEQKQYTKAMESFNRALQVLQTVKSPELEPHVAYKLGVSAFYAQQYLTAAMGFGKVVDNYPTSQFAEDSLFMRARALDLQNQAIPARDAYVQYLAKYPRSRYSLDACVAAGRSALIMKQTTAARGDLEKALRLYEDMRRQVPALVSERGKSLMSEAQYYMAQTYYDEKNYPDAFKQYAAVPESIEPWASRALLQMARCSMLLGNRQDAMDVLQSLLRKYPDSEVAQQVPQVAKEYGLELKNDK